jgi:hypothetical protein
MATFVFNLIFMNCFQVNHATYKIQMTSYYVEEGESGEELNGGGGGRREGAGAWPRPDSGRQGVGADSTVVEEDTKEERVGGWWGK